MTGPIFLRILDLVRDGQLTQCDVALLTERYRNPGFGYKRLARQLGVSVRTVGRRWKRMNRLALSLVE
jgi:DNA-binding Lrp family transcriptional regulator